MGSLKNICSNSDIETLCRSPNLRAFPSSQSNPTHCAKRSVMPIRYVYNSYIRMSSGLISEGPIGIERGLAAPPLSHHRTYGSRIRRVGRFSQGGVYLSQPECPLPMRQPQGHPRCRAQAQHLAGCRLTAPPQATTPLYRSGLWWGEASGILRSCRSRLVASTSSTLC